MGISNSSFEFGNFHVIGTARALYLLQLPSLAAKIAIRRYGALAVLLRRAKVILTHEKCTHLFFIIKL